MEGAGKKVVAGSAWMLLFKFSERSLGIISTIVLARLLVPADFGLVALATAFIGILQLFSDFNFDVVLIRQPGMDRRQYDTAWTFNVAVAVCIAAVLLLMAPAIATFYEDSRLRAVISVLAIAVVLQGVGNIGVVQFRKELQFQKEFMFLVVGKVAGFFVTIPLAFLLRTHWALVGGIIASRLASLCMSYYAHPYRPRLSMAARGELLHTSKWLLGNNITNFSRERSSDFIVGKIVGTQGLGLYNMAQEIVTLPTTELVAPVNRAVYPMYARLLGDLSQLRHTYLQVLSMVAMIALPAAIGIGLTADLLVPILLGSNWLETIPLMEVLAVAGAIAALQSNSWSVFIALGKMRTLTYLGACSLVVMVPMLIVLTTFYGPLGAALSYLIIMSLLVVATYTLLLRDLSLSLSRLLTVFWRPLCGIGVMVVVVLALESQWTGAAGFTVGVFRLATAVSCGAGSYVLAVLILWRLAGKPDGAERIILEKLWPVFSERLAFARKPRKT